jgi:uncharacterized protein YkwD
MPHRRIILMAAVLLALLVPASAAAAATPARMMLHELNRVRVAHGLPRVHMARGLRSAARAHTLDMLRHDYFAHTSPRGSTLFSRIVASPFVTRGPWTAGETLAWGSGLRGRPRAVVRAWLRSPSHRAIVLSAAYRWVGISGARGPFQGAASARVWTADWAHR